MAVTLYEYLIEFLLVLANIYTITPDTLIKDLGKSYSTIFEDKVQLSDTDYAVMNKLFGDLFDYVPVDICRLSDLADVWANQISTINDFIELFYANLPQWGLPYKKALLPKASDITKKKNILKLEYDFISRQLFKRLSKSQYVKYQKQIKKYSDLEKEYSENWEGWKDQGIKSFEAFAEIVKGFIRGEKIQEYKNLLIKTDFTVIEDVLGIKIETESKERWL